MTLAHPLVYVIDDDRSMLKAIGRLLESGDYSVELFTGAGEFLARAPHTGPSCVILDLNMPGLNGLELQEALVGKGRVEQVIFITGGASVPTCVQAMKAGAVDYLPKPFRDENLLHAVERALKRSSEQWLQRS
jgi:FixJ family two-component response regulator